MKRLALLVALTLAGCGGQLAPDDQDQLKIGFIPKSLNQEYWVNTEKGAQAGARGKAKLLTKAAGADTEIVEQIDLVENLLALVLTGCGGQLAGGNDDELKIGFVPKSLNQEYWVNTEKGAQATAWRWPPQPVTSSTARTASRFTRRRLLPRSSRRASPGSPWSAPPPPRSDPGGARRRGRRPRSRAPCCG